MGRGRCLVCTGFSKASAALEEAVDQKRISSKQPNGNLRDKSGSTSTDVKARTSSSTAAPQGRAAAAADTSVSGRQLRGRAVGGQTQSANGSTGKGKAGARTASASDDSVQESTAEPPQQGAAVGGSSDASLQERQHSGSDASTSTAPVEEEPPSEHLSGRQTLAFCRVQSTPASALPIELHRVGVSQARVLAAGKTVRLIRGPGGAVRRAEPADSPQQSRAAAGSPCHAKRQRQR